MWIKPRFKSIVEQAILTQMKTDQIRELSPKLPADEGEFDSLLQHLVERRIGGAFASVVLAALDAGRTFDARHLIVGATMLPAELIIPSIAMRCTGDVAAALLKAVEDQRLDTMFSAVCVLVAAQWRHAHRPGSSLQDIATEFRVLRRRRHTRAQTPAVMAAIAEVLAEIGEEHPWPELRERRNRKLFNEAARYLEDIGETVRSPILDRLGRPGKGWTLSGYTVRSPVPRKPDGSKWGRNDLCHCGSGKKYKKCCERKDKARWHDASDVEGKTWSEMELEPEKYMDEKRLMNMSPSDLVPLEPAKVDPALHGPMLDKLLAGREFETIVRFVKEIGWRPELAPHVTEAMCVAADMGKVDLVRQLMEVSGDLDEAADELPFAVRLALAADAEETLTVIEQEVLQKVDEPSSEIAISILASRYPGLGILLARSVLATQGMTVDAQEVLDDLMETRERLELPPDDPIEEVLEKVTRYRKKTTSAALEAREKELEEKNGQQRALRAERARLRQELAQAQRARRLAEKDKDAARSEAEAALQAAKEDPRVADLTRRLKAVEDESKLQHAERSELRRELEKARREIEEQAAREAAAPSDRGRKDEVDVDAGWVPVNLAITQNVRRPVVPERVFGQMKKLPRRVSAEAMQLVGGLAGAEKAAWKGVLHLQHERELQRRRFAGDYRLIFKVDDNTGILEVVEVVDRKELDRRVRRLA